MFTKILFVIALFVPAAICGAESPPKILGIAQVTLYAHDLAASRAFYQGYLGFPEIPADSNHYFVSDHQSIQLLPEKEAGDRFVSLSLQTDDAEGLRAVLAAEKVAVPDKIDNGSFSVTDPDNHVIQFLQLASPLPTLPGADLRISTRIPHAGIIVTNLDASLHFYHDLLNLQETWRGANNPKTLSWVNLKVPDGKDYLEFMLFPKLPAEENRRTPHHICLEVDDVAKTWEVLKTRTMPANLKTPTPMKVGINGKRQINLYDPDGTRVEIMEPNTFSGRPVPPSTLPAPKTELLYTPGTVPATQK